MHAKLIVFCAITIILLEYVNGRPPLEPTKTNCGYQSCNPVKEGFINVHLVPHTHDDVGWLKTVDQYYYGSRTDIQNAGVQYILDSVIEALKKDANRRFIYVETAFFWKWWIKQHDTVKSVVRNLVNNGRLEFIGGAWTMNDEAAAHYHSIIDQFTWGLRKLNETFGECGRPKIGWQIDPFGHSREMASIFAQLGFDGVLLGRIDYEDKEFRLKTKTMEMVWRSSDSLGDKSEIFTGILYNNYAPPRGFCFDILCSDDPIIDDPKSTEYNVDQRVDDFFAFLHNATESYTTSNVLITMGEDFNYQDAHVWFKNMDKLIHYANERQVNGSKYNLIYSTPSCYVKAVHDETNGKKKWVVKQDDFFPYSSDPHAFWTGYFTSRPTIKRFERVGNNFLQVCKQLYALTDLGPEDWVDLNALREAMGVMQHHDAVTGTEKQHVANDYARILQHGIDECQFITATALSKLIQPNATTINDEPVPAILFESCLLTNTSSCGITETSENFVVTVYNPLSRPVNHYVRVPVLGTAYTVTDPKGVKLDVQLVPIPESILAIPGRKSEAKIEMIFVASDLPPLGFKSYFVQRTTGDNVVKHKAYHHHMYGDISFSYSQRTGMLAEIIMNNVTLLVDQEFLYYEGFVGDNQVATNRSSGAYIFRPNGTTAQKVTDKADVKVYTGDLVTEIHQTFNKWISQIIRIFNKENFVELDWLVGPIPTDAPNGKEIISRFKANLSSDSIFYTDSNGRELLKRVRDFRPTWQPNLQEPIAGNYYPVTSKILIRDEAQGIELAVLTDRAQGGSSLTDGEIELMVHRNCLHDDAFGVNEPLMEQAFDAGLVTRGSHYVIIGPIRNNTQGLSTTAQERDLAQRKLLDSWVFFFKSNETTFDEYKATHIMEFAGLKASLPNNVQILTLEPWTGFSFLLRLEHVFELDEDPELSKPVTVDLKELFAPFDVIGIAETTLGGNQWLNQNERLVFSGGDNIEDLVNQQYYAVDEKVEAARRKWYRNNKNFSNYVKRDVGQSEEKDGDDYNITLSPMQIRTFVIDIKKH